MLAMAMERAPVAMESAPPTPSNLMERNTDTTSAFRGIPKRFMITERCESGMYLLRKVEIEGKYIPTHNSKRKKAATIGISGAVGARAEAVPAAIATVATTSIPSVETSVRTFLAIALKMVEPRRQDNMKHEKTTPKGVVAPEP